MIEVNQQIFLAGGADQKKEQSVHRQHHEGEDQHVNYFEVDPHENDLQGQEQAEGESEQDGSKYSRVIEDTDELEIIVECAQQILSLVFDTYKSVANDAHSDISEGPDGEVKHVPVDFRED